MFFGLHFIDVLVVAFFVIVIIVIGIISSRGVQNESDFFVGGRKMGGLLQFFLNFGQMADSNSAPSVASEVYREGIGGIWIAFQLLLMTPFYWFSSIWFRRARLVTLADLFLDRFGSRRLAAGFAAISLLISILGMGLGNIISYKVVSALLAKPEAAWTSSERQSIQDYQTYRELTVKKANTALSSEEKATYAILDNRERRGRLSSYVSYIQPLPFYISYTAVVGLFIMLGGIKAAALTDAVQGVLTIIFSVILVPLGLARTGGFHAIHQMVDTAKFNLISSGGSSDYTWYSVAAIVLFGILGIAGQTVGPASAAARNENAARIGALTGAFAKRLLTLPWAFCGILALAILGPALTDPDAAWGRLSSVLLMPGLTGLMLAGMILGHMPYVGVSAVNMSALISRNLYEPFVPNRPEGHYFLVARAMIFVVLALGVGTSLLFSGVISMMFTMWLFGAILSMTLGLVYFWRGLTMRGIGLSWVVWTVLIGVVPSLVPQIPSLRQSSFLLLQTESSQVANADAVIFTPQPLFFESIATVSDGPLSGSEGIGRFNVEAFILYQLGVPLKKFNSAGLLTARWLFDTLVPFILLIGFSKCMRQKSSAERMREDLFFAKMKTPIGSSGEKDAHELELNRGNPGRFDHLKLFPRTNWEFTKWSRNDVLGFAGCWVLVGIVLGLLWGMIEIGK